MPLSFASPVPPLHLPQLHRPTAFHCPLLKKSNKRPARAVSARVSCFGAARSRRSSPALPPSSSTLVGVKVTKHAVVKHKTQRYKSRPTSKTCSSQTLRNNHDQHVPCPILRMQVCLQKTLYDIDSSCHVKGGFDLQSHKLPRL